MEGKEESIKLEGRAIDLDGSRSVFLGRTDRFPGSACFVFLNGEQKTYLRVSEAALKVMGELIRDEKQHSFVWKMVENPQPIEDTK